MDYDSWLTDSTPLPTCTECGEPVTHPGDTGDLCDTCYDEGLAEAMGY